MTILEILNEIAATRSKKEKVAIMTQHKDNADLKEFFRLCLHPQINFFQKKDLGHIPEGELKISLTTGMNYLCTFISTRTFTGHEALNGIKATISQMGADDVVVMRRILKKKTECGVDSSVNDVWSKLIPEHPNLLASPYSEKLAAALNWEKGCVCEMKSDGLRLSVHIQDGDVVCYSRAGNVLDLHGRFDKLGNIPALSGQVIDCELMVVKPDGAFESRKVGNGLCSKAIKGTMTIEESKRLVVVAWDVIPEEVFFGGETCTVGMSARFDQLKNLVAFDGVSELVRLIKHDIVYSIEEAQSIYQKYRDAGEEGAMLKDPDVMWADRRSKRILKLKAEETAELKVTGYNDGQGEFVGYVGSLRMESRDGKVVVNMSGFSLKLRAEISANLFNKAVKFSVAVADNQWEDFWAFPGDTEINIGSIVEVTYNEKIKSRDSDVWSLFLPRFDKVRHDKTEANSFEEIK